MRFFVCLSESARQHPAPAALNQPGSLVPGQEPAPSYPPVPSPPDFQSLCSPETTEKEIGTVSPMRVHLGSMLGERPRSRENRCVGGQMGPGSTPWHKTRPTAGRWAVCTEPHQCTRASRDLRAGGTVRGHTAVEVVLPEHCRRYRSQPGCVWRPFWLF